MTDFRRMEWQVKANRAANAVLIACCLMIAPEVVVFLHARVGTANYFWMIIATAVIGSAAYFIERHTAMYRWDR